MVFLAWIFRKRITALNHEASDHAMKTGAVVKSLFGERFEILDRLGRDSRPELKDDLAFGRLDHCYSLSFPFGGFVFFSVFRFRFLLPGLAGVYCDAMPRDDKK